MSEKDWIRITISVRKTTANRVLRVKNEYGLTYEDLFSEYVRLRSMIKPLFKPSRDPSRDLILNNIRYLKK